MRSIFCVLKLEKEDLKGGNLVLEILKSNKKGFA